VALAWTDRLLIRYVLIELAFYSESFGSARSCRRNPLRQTSKSIIGNAEPPQGLAVANAARHERGDLPNLL
jgi:hypothetical protein